MCQLSWTSSVAGERGGLAENDEVSVDWLSWRSGWVSFFGHVGTITRGSENSCNGLGTAAGGSLERSLCGAEQQLVEDFGDSAFEESSVVASKVCKAVFVDGGGRLLEDGALAEVARVEDCKVLGSHLSSLGDLELGCLVQVWRHRQDWLVEGDSRGDALAQGRC